MHQEGIIYVAMGERFVEEASLSAATARRHMPSLPITIFTDAPPPRGGPFDRIVEIAREAETIVGHPLPGKVMRGGHLASYRRKAAQTAAQ